MRADGSSLNGGGNSVQHRADLVFARMGRYIGRLADAKPQDVHRFRTNSRRVEALVQELVPANRNRNKLLKMLSKGRKKAGKARDLDVQIAFLKTLRIPDRNNQRMQLLDVLAQEHARRSKKLARYFDKERVAELRKRLRKAQSELNLNGIDPLTLAYRRMPNPGDTPLTENVLHACRIAAKRVRYLAELADSDDAKILVEELKRAQDEIGHWHDLLKLTECAQNMFGGVSRSPLVSALQNITRARFRSAVGALRQALKVVAELEQGAAAQPRASERAVPATQSAAA